MRLLVLLLVTASVCHARPSVKDMPWPGRVREFPAGEQVSFVSGRYEVRHRIPADPAVQSAGGFGGPIVELAIHDRRSGWRTSFTTQSVGERLLVSWHGKPQIEVWGRVGDGSYTASSTGSTAACVSTNLSMYPATTTRRLRLPRCRKSSTARHLLMAIPPCISSRPVCPNTRRPIMSNEDPVTYNYRVVGVEHATNGAYQKASQ